MFLPAEDRHNPCPDGGLMFNITVLILDAPQMLREILEQAISKEPDMRLMPESAASAVPSGETGAPDVVVVGGTAVEPGERARALLARWPRTRVLMITGGGHKVLQYELLPHGIDFGEMSPRQLVEAIRTAVAERTLERVTGDRGRTGWRE
jgi:DNA-binding NarL/FixJ family response regulator